MSPKYVISFINTFIWYPTEFTFHYIFLAVPAFCAPAYYSALPSPLSLVLFFSAPTTSIHPHPALLPPVGPLLSFPHPLHLTSVSSSRPYVCHHPSIDTFNPSHLQAPLFSLPVSLFSPSLLGYFRLFLRRQKG